MAFEPRATSFSMANARYLPRPRPLRIKEPAVREMGHCQRLHRAIRLLRQRRHAGLRRRERRRHHRRLSRYAAEPSDGLVRGRPGHSRKVGPQHRRGSRRLLQRAAQRLGRHPSQGRGSSETARQPWQQDDLDHRSQPRRRARRTVRGTGHVVSRIPVRVSIRSDSRASATRTSPPPSTKNSGLASSASSTIATSCRGCRCSRWASVTTATRRSYDSDGKGTDAQSAVETLKGALAFGKGAFNLAVLGQAAGLIADGLRGSRKATSPRSRRRPSASARPTSSGAVSRTSTITIWKRTISPG